MIRQRNGGGNNRKMTCATSGKIVKLWTIKNNIRVQGIEIKIDGQDEKGNLRQNARNSKLEEKVEQIFGNLSTVQGKIQDKYPKANQVKNGITTMKIY